MERDQALMVARGVHSTLSVERRELLKRMQAPCAIVYTEINAAYTEMQRDVPDWSDVFRRLDHARSIINDVESMATTLRPIVEERAEVRKVAWGGADE